MGRRPGKRCLLLRVLLSLDSLPPTLSGIACEYGSFLENQSNGWSFPNNTEARITPADPYTPLHSNPR